MQGAGHWCSGDKSSRTWEIVCRYEGPGTVKVKEAVNQETAMTVYKQKHNNSVKPIAIALIFALLANNVAWAHPEKFKLGIPSFFGGLRDYQIRNIGMIRAYLKYIESVGQKLSAINGDVNARINVKGKDLALTLGFSPEKREELQSLRMADANSHLIPCQVNRAAYYAYITLGENSDIQKITVYTKKQFEELKRRGVVSHRKRPEKEEWKIRHEEEIDTPLAITHSVVQPLDRRLELLEKRIMKMTGTKEMEEVYLLPGRECSYDLAYRMVFAWIAGKAIKLKLDNFSSEFPVGIPLPVIYKELMKTLGFLQDSLTMTFDDINHDFCESDTGFNAIYAVRKLIKNAFVHGNALDVSRPIYIYMDLDLSGSVKGINVFDTASIVSAKPENLELARDALLTGHGEARGQDGGFGLGCRNLDWEFIYSRTAMRDKEGVIGTFAQAKRPLVDNKKDHGQRKDKVDLEILSSRIWTAVIEFLKDFEASDAFKREAEEFIRTRVTVMPGTLSFTLDIDGFQKEIDINIEDAHASNHFINIPAGSHREIAGHVIHELGAKCGLEHKTNDRLEKAYKEWADGALPGEVSAEYPEVNLIPNLRFKDLRRVKNRDLHAESPTNKGPFEPGQVIEGEKHRFRIIRFSDDQGTQSYMYKAEDLYTHEKIAVKVIKSPDVERQKWLFQKEIGILKTLTDEGHAFVPEFVDSDNDSKWYAMEWIEGELLYDWVKGKRPDELIPAIIDILKMSQVLERHGLDGSIFLRNQIFIMPGGCIKLFDFGSLYELTGEEAFYEYFIERLGSLVFICALGRRVRSDSETELAQSLLDRGREDWVPYAGILHAANTRRFRTAREMIDALNEVTTRRFIERFAEQMAGSDERGTRENVEEEFRYIAKEAIISSEVVKAYSTKIKRPVIVSGIIRMGVPYTWAMEDPLADLSASERDEFHREVRQAEIELPNGLPHRHYIAQLNVAESWMNRGRLKWFYVVRNSKILSGNNSASKQAAGFFDDLKPVLTNTTSGLVFLDATIRKHEPNSFSTIRGLGRKSKRSQGDIKYATASFGHPDNISRISLTKGDEENKTDLYVGKGESKNEPCVISAKRFDEVCKELTADEASVPCLLFNASRLYWEGSYRPFGLPCIQDDEQKFGKALDETARKFDEPWLRVCGVETPVHWPAQAYKDGGIFNTVVTHMAAKLRASGWDPQVFKPAGEEGARRAESGVAGKEKRGGSPGPALFIDTSKDHKVRELEGDNYEGEHFELNEAIRKIVPFGEDILEEGYAWNQGWVLDRVQVEELFGDRFNHLMETGTQLPTRIHILKDDALRNALREGYEYLADGLITHAGTWRDFNADGTPIKRKNLFLTESAYLALLAAIRSREKASQDAVDFWREHEIYHLDHRDDSTYSIKDGEHGFAYHLFMLKNIFDFSFLEQIPVSNDSEPPKEHDQPSRLWLYFKSFIMPLDLGIKAVHFEKVLDMIEQACPSKAGTKIKLLQILRYYFSDENLNREDLTISLDQYKRVWKYFDKSNLDIIAGSIYLSCAAISLSDDRVIIQGDPDKCDADRIAKDRLRNFICNRDCLHDMASGTENMLVDPWIAFLRCAGDGYVDFALGLIHERWSGGEPAIKKIREVFLAPLCQYEEARHIRARLAKRVVEDADFNVTSPVDNAEGALRVIFDNDKNARAFFKMATALRLVYPYEITSQDMRPPLQYALEEDIVFHLGANLYMTPITESFRRHIIFARGPDGEIRFSFEVVIPGQRESSRRVYAEKRVRIANEMNDRYDGKEFFVEPIGWKELPEGKYDFYDETFEFNVKLPLQICAFEYTEDGKRLESLKPYMIDAIAESGGLQRQVLCHSIASQVAEITNAIYKSGYVGSRLGADNILHTDLHTGNFRFIVKDGAIKIIQVGDSEAFSKFSGGGGIAEKRLFDYQALITGTMSYSGQIEPGLSQILAMNEKNLAKFVFLPWEHVVAYTQGFVGEYNRLFSKGVEDSVTYGMADREMDILAKEAIISQEMAERFSRKTGRPVFVVSLGEKGVPFTWFRTGVMLQLTGEESSKFGLEVHQEKGDGEGEAEETRAILSVANRWMNTGDAPKLKYFVYHKNFHISSDGSSGPSQAEAFINTYRQVFTNVRPMFLFIDSSPGEDKFPGSFFHLTREIVKQKESKAISFPQSCTMVAHPQNEYDENASDLDDPEQPYYVSDRFFSRMCDGVACVLFDPARLTWDGRTRLFGKKAWSLDTTKFGRTVRAVQKFFPEGYPDLLHRAINARVRLLRGNGWDPQVFKPAGEEGTRRAEKGVEGKEKGVEGKEKGVEGKENGVEGKEGDFGPVLFVDPDTDEVRELSMEEHNILNPALKKIVFDRQKKPMRPARAKNLLGDKFYERLAINGVRPAVYIIPDDELYEELPRNLAFGLVTHVGTYKERAWNFFIPVSIYLRLLRLINQNTPDSMRAVQFWRGHEADHLIRKGPGRRLSREEAILVRSIFELKEERNQKLIYKGYCDKVRALLDDMSSDDSEVAESALRELIDWQVSYRQRPEVMNGRICLPLEITLGHIKNWDFYEPRHDAIKKFLISLPKGLLWWVVNVLVKIAVNNIGNKERCDKICSLVGEMGEEAFLRRGSKGDRAANPYGIIVEALRAVIEVCKNERAREVASRMLEDMPDSAEIEGLLFSEECAGETSEEPAIRTNKRKQSAEFMPFWFNLAVTAFITVVATLLEYKELDGLKNSPIFFMLLFPTLLFSILAYRLCLYLVWLSENKGEHRGAGFFGPLSMKQKKLWIVTGFGWIMACLLIFINLKLPDLITWSQEWEPIVNGLAVYLFINTVIILTIDCFSTLFKGGGDSGQEKEAKVASPEESAGDRDLKGAEAPDSDKVIRELLGENEFVEVEYDRSTQGLKGWMVKDLGKGYIPGKTSKGKYRGEAILIDRLFTEEEKTNLIDWIESNRLKAPPKEDDARRTSYICFRIALNRTALRWKTDLKHSNVAHAGYKDRCVYIGEYFLKYLMRNRHKDLRQKVLTEDEKWHLEKKGNRRHRDRDALNERRRLAEKAVREIHAAHRKAEKTLATSLLFEQATRELEKKETFYTHGLLERIDALRFSCALNCAEDALGYDRTIRSAQLYVFNKAVPRFQKVLLTKPEADIGSAVKIETAIILRDLLREKTLGDWEREKILGYGLGLFRSRYPSRYDDFEAAVNSEKGKLLDPFSLYLAEKIVLSDPLIKDRMGMISEGARVNFRLKAYHMLWKEGASCGEVVTYLGERIDDCIMREKDLRGLPLIGCEVEIWKRIKTYPLHSARVLADHFGLISDKRLHQGHDDIQIEFNPLPARDWRDLAEMIDTMKELGLIPFEEGSFYPFHISMSRYDESALNTIEEDEFSLGLSYIVIAEMLLTTPDERLESFDVPYGGTYREKRYQERVKREGLFADRAEFKFPCIVTSNKAEKDPGSYRKALRMQYLMHTALMTVYSRERKGNQYTDLSKLCERFNKKFSAFLKRNDLDYLTHADQDGRKIRDQDCLAGIVAKRRHEPNMCENLREMVEAYLMEIEKVLYDESYNKRDLKTKVCPIENLMEMERKDDSFVREEFVARTSHGTRRMRFMNFRRLMDAGYLVEWRHEPDRSNLVTTYGHVRMDTVERSEERITNRVSDMIGALRNMAVNLTIGDNMLLALDEDLYKPGTEALIRKVIKDICAIHKKPEWERLLKNLKIIKGRGKGLANKISAYTGKKGKDGIKVKKSNVIMVTKEFKREQYEDLITNGATVTFVDDSEMELMDYYPYIELVLFTLAKRLREMGVPGYGDEKLVELYRRLPVEEELRRDIVKKYIDGSAVTVKLKKAEPFEYDELQYLYKRVREYLEAA